MGSGLEPTSFVQQLPEKVLTAADRAARSVYGLSVLSLTGPQPPLTKCSTYKIQIRVLACKMAWIKISAAQILLSNSLFPILGVP